MEDKCGLGPRPRVERGVRELLPRRPEWIQCLVGGLFDCPAVAIQKVTETRQGRTHRTPRKRVTVSALSGESRPNTPCSDGLRMRAAILFAPLRRTSAAMRGTCKRSTPMPWMVMVHRKKTTRLVQLNYVSAIKFAITPCLRNHPRPGRAAMLYPSVLNHCIRQA